MLSYKNLLMAAKAVENPPDALKFAIEESQAFLTSSKSFEYGGKINSPHGSVIKLVDISMDLDDVFKMLADKRTDIKGSGEIYIIWTPEPPPTKEPVVVIPVQTPVPPIVVVDTNPSLQSNLPVIIDLTKAGND